MSCTVKPWTYWEDYPQGLWTTDQTWETDTVNLSRVLLCDPDMFFAAANLMIEEWSISACAHLSERGRGRRAWVGQATCCHRHGASGWATREAWSQMTITQRTIANDVALMAILDWESQNAGAHQLPGVEYRG